VPRTCRVSGSVENIQRHNNTRIKDCFLSLSCNAETILLREDEFADTDVSEENTGMDSTYMRVGGRAVTEKELTVRTVADLSYLVGGGK
jgi:hypothetical protein